MRRRLSYANVMATISVFIALGGTTYAAVTITGSNVKDSSLTGKDVKDGSLTGKDVKNNTIGGVDVANGSLLSADFKPGQLPQGPPGANGVSAGATGTGGPGIQDPPATPYSGGYGPSADATLTTTRASKLIVTGWVEAAIACPSTAGTCQAAWGLYVDGVPVTGTGYPLYANQGNSTVQFIHVAGTSASLAPGTHTVTLKSTRSSGIPSYDLFNNNMHVTAVAIDG
jgi:hypothetical protein